MIAPAKENDRVFLVIRADGRTDQRADWILPLRRQGYPVVRLDLPRVTDLPALMYGLEKTVAAIGWLWDINIVDQDAVEGYKEEGRKVRDSGKAFGKPEGQHIARYSHLELYYDSIIKQGLITEAQLYGALLAIGGDKQNAAHVYAAILMVMARRTGLYKDFRFYGHPTDQVRSIIQQFRGVFSQRFKRVTQFGIGPDVNHKRHQQDADGFNSGLYTLIAASEHEQVTAGAYSEIGRASC